MLLTGDGVGYDDGVGFHADLERMAKGGWGVEVLSWDVCCKKTLKEWATTAGVFIPLENYYDQITFIEGGRNVESLKLTSRPKAAIIPTDNGSNQASTSLKKRRIIKAKERSQEAQKKAEKIKKRRKKKKRS